MKTITYQLKSLNKFLFDHTAIRKLQELSLSRKYHTSTKINDKFREKKQNLPENGVKAVKTISKK